MDTNVVHYYLSIASQRFPHKLDLAAAVVEAAGEHKLGRNLHPGLPTYSVAGQWAASQYNKIIVTNLEPSVYGNKTAIMNMDTPFLTPIEKPKGLLWKLVYYFTRKRFGKVLTPLKVMAARLPLGFGNFSGQIGQLDKKLQLPAETVMLIRECVARINVCYFCMDIGRSQTIMASMDQAKFDALGDYQTSTLFSTKEKVLLDYVGQLARNRTMERQLFDKLAVHYDERSICEIVWVVTTEFYYNIGNIGLNIHSDMLCNIAKRKTN